MEGEETLETLIAKITNPKQENEDWGFIMEFVDKVTQTETGSAKAANLILERVRIGPERSSLFALSLLSVCANNCGSSFHAVIGKFKFLNELIKLVTTKYNPLTPVAVKQYILDLIQAWVSSISHESKIAEAYELLCRQGHQFSEMPISTNPLFLQKPQRGAKSAFQEMETHAVLASLLRSKKPGDLERANKLIKNMVNEDFKADEQASKLRREISVVQNNVKLLTEILVSHNSEKDGNIAENDLVQELCQSCVAMQPRLQELIGEMNSDTDTAQILAINDDMNKAFDMRKALVAGKPINGIATETSTVIETTTKVEEKGESLINLMDLDVSVDTSSLPQKAVNSQSLVNDDLLLLGIGDNNTNSNNSQQAQLPLNDVGINLDGFAPHQPQPQPLFQQTIHQQPQQYKKNLNDSLSLDLDLDLGSTTTVASTNMAPVLPLSNVYDPVSAMVSGSSTTHLNGGMKSLSLGNNEIATSNRTDSPIMLNNGHRSDSLADISINVENVELYERPPQTLYDKDGLRVLCHIAKPGIGDTPSSPSIRTCVLSFMNSLATPLNDFIFQVAVPKTMKLRLQAASSSIVAAFNPLKAAVAVTQVMLIQMTVPDEPLRIRFKVSFVSGDAPFSDVGQVQLN